MESRTVSPSDLSFLFEECKACFWLKVVKKMYRPFTPFPGVFNMMDRLQKTLFSTLRSEAIVAPGLEKPLLPGSLFQGELKVMSSPFLTANGTEFAFSGKMDMGYDFDDGTVGIVDFKTSAVNVDSIRKYQRQLNAYRECLEHPVSGNAHTVSRMGLLYFTPDSMNGSGLPHAVTMRLLLKWVEIGRVDVVKELTDILSLRERPNHDANCNWIHHYAGKEATL